jgi:DNA-directed RNA polymerase subunit RPC12/RpoP
MGRKSRTGVESRTRLFAQVYDYPHSFKCPKCKQKAFDIYNEKGAYTIPLQCQSCKNYVLVKPYVGESVVQLIYVTTSLLFFWVYAKMFNISIDNIYQNGVWVILWVVFNHFYTWGISILLKRFNIKKKLIIPREKFSGYLKKFKPNLFLIVVKMMLVWLGSLFAVGKYLEANRPAVYNDVVYYFSGNIVVPVLVCVFITVMSIMYTNVQRLRYAELLYNFKVK